MSEILGFSVLDGVTPQAAFVAADAEIHIGDRLLDGELFLASRRGQVAACVRAKNEYIGPKYLSEMAARGQLGLRVETEGRSGLTVATAARFTFSGGSNVWPAGRHYDLLEGSARDWWASVTVASSGLGLGTRASLPIPAATRPAGTEEPIEIDIRGAIGADTAERVSKRLGPLAYGNSTVLLTIESEGGNLNEGLKIYRALARWPCAVYAHIERRAASAAALVALAADVRSIEPEATMLLHQPSIQFEEGERLEVKDLLTCSREIIENLKTMIGLVAVATGVDSDTAENWCVGEVEFTAGEALACGLVQAIQSPDVPAMPRALRAKFAPIDGPYARVVAR